MQCKEYEHQRLAKTFMLPIDILTFIASVYFIGILCCYSLPDIVADFF